MSPDSTLYQAAMTDGVSIVKVLDPELLINEKGKFYELAERLGADAKSRGVVLNLTNLHAFQSTMIGVLINFQKRLKAHDKALRLCEADTHVLRVFQLTKMDQIFDIQPTEPAAIKSIQGKSGSGWLSRILGMFSRSHE